jgi:MFS family permease
MHRADSSPRAEVGLVSESQQYPWPLWRGLTAAILGTLVLRTASGATGLMIGIYLRHINDTVHAVSATEVGLIGAAFFVAELGGSPFFGAQSDCHGQRLYMVLGSLLGAMAMLIPPLTVFIPLLLVARLMEGLSAASSVPATLSYISAATAHSTALRGRVVSLYEIATIGGFALGGLVGGLLWQWDQRYGFHLVVIIYLVSAVIFAFGAELTPRGRATGREPVGYYVSLLMERKVLRFAPAWLAVNAIVGLWFNHLPFQMSGARIMPNQNLMGGFSGAAIGPIFALYFVLFGTGVFLWGLTFTRLRREDIMVIALGGLFISSSGLFAVNHVALANRPLLILFLLVFLVGVLVESGFTPAALGYLADLSEDFVSDRGSIMGLYSVLMGLGQLLGSGIGGPFADQGGVDGIITLTILLGFASFLSVWVLRNGVTEPERAGERSPSE